jgi:hypothetical protein
MEIEGSFRRLNYIGLEVMDSLAAIHVAGRPLLPVSTDSQAQDALLNRCVNIAIMSRPELTQSVASQPLGWAVRPALEAPLLVV